MSEGSYEYHSEIYIIYGAGERYVSTAKVNKKTLLKYLEKSGNSNPTIKVGGRQVNFTKTLDNKEFKRKLLNNF